MNTARVACASEQPFRATPANQTAHGGNATTVATSKGQPSAPLAAQRIQRLLLAASRAPAALS
jgi:hypothetical protein